MPIEVLGEGTQRSVSIPLPTLGTDPLVLRLKVHGLSYEGKASVQCNETAPILVRNDTVTVEGLGREFQGIGGAFHTLRVRISLPPGTLRSGENTIRFRFLRTDGLSIGYRILELSVLAGNRALFTSVDQWPTDDPSSWRPPQPSPESIREGERLWRTGLVRAPAILGGAPLRAKCQDCHAQDGRDLHYFNYSNHSIVERAKFHGMTQDQGEKIASYIRSLNSLPNPGRPWNPPYQPGPGLDARPVEHWSAGAGIDAVLETDEAMFSQLFPGGFVRSAFHPDRYVNPREMPVFLQFPDWNHWLPRIHPFDAWGDDFDVSDLNLRAAFRQVQAAGHTDVRSLRLPNEELHRDIFSFFLPRLPTDIGNRSVDHARKIYATGTWVMVKTWERMHEFGMEDKIRRMYPASRDIRGWFENLSFDTSPHLLHMYKDVSGINNNAPLMHTYFSSAWYHLALVLNHGNRTDGEDYSGQRPIDWPYSYGFVKDINWDSGVPTAALLTYWLKKGMEVANNGKGPHESNLGWNIEVANVFQLVAWPHRPGWSRTSQAAKRTILENFLFVWLERTNTFTPSQWQSSVPDINHVPVSNTENGNNADRIWYSLPRFRHEGVSQTLLNSVAQWARQVWPRGDWARAATANCRPVEGLEPLQCDSD